MPDLTPITREEMFLDGNTELTPITREEKILAGEDIDVITRREWFLKKYRGGGGGGGYQIKDIPNTPCDIATFTDGANLPMPKLEVGIEPVQEGSGDPSPENIRPIIGWDEVNVTRCGKNFIGKGTQLNGFVNTATMQFNEDSNSVGYYFNTNDLPDEITFNAVNGNRAYYGYFNVIPRDGAVCLDVNQSQQTLPKTITVNKTYKYIHLQFSYNQSITNVQIENGSTSTTYEPYNGTTYTIPFTDAQGNPVEVFGGSCDVVNGGEQQRTLGKIILNGTENGWNTDLVGTENKRRFTCIGLPNLGVTETTTFDAISNMSKNTKSNDYINMDNVFILRYLSQYGTNRIDIMTEAYQDIESFKAFLNSNNMQIVYELATPFTFYTQPTSIKSIEGTNNVWGDCGQITEGSYFSESEEE